MTATMSLQTDSHFGQAALLAWTVYLSKLYFVMSKNMELLDSTQVPFCPHCLEWLEGYFVSLWANCICWCPMGTIGDVCESNRGG